MFLISPLDGFEIQIEPYGPTRLTRTVSWVCSLNPKLVLHKKYSGPCELRLNLLGLRAVAGSHGSGWSKKRKKKKKKMGPLMLCHFLRWTLAFLSLILTTNPKMRPKTHHPQVHKIKWKWKEQTLSLPCFFCVFQQFSFFSNLLCFLSAFILLASLGVSFLLMSLVPKTAKP